MSSTYWWHRRPNLMTSSSGDSHWPLRHTVGQQTRREAMVSQHHLLGLSQEEWGKPLEDSPFHIQLGQMLRRKPCLIVSKAAERCRRISLDALPLLICYLPEEQLTLSLPKTEQAKAAVRYKFTWRKMREGRTKQYTNIVCSDSCDCDGWKKSCWMHGNYCW